MSLYYIWAQDEQGLIGREGTLPWRLPNDLKFFKQVTLGHTIVMGRKTFDGMGKRLLPNRHTIVLTKDGQYDGQGAEVLHEPAEILERAKGEDLFVIGGGQLFAYFAPYVSRLYQTKIAASFEGDTYMPELPFEDFDLQSKVEGLVDEKNPYPHTFFIYQRKTETH